MANSLNEFILNGDVVSIRNYLESGGSFENVTVLNSEGFRVTPLELASIAEVGGSGSPEVTKLILERSSEETQTNILYRFASEDSNLNSTKALLKAGIKLDGMMQKDPTSTCRREWESENRI
ncbi:Ankyrin repeat protein [Leptospira santarosai]|uniref:Ankyrin repeat protein n=1 Tax=Leptospira santarosai TaxID=28183 RepID=A0A2P1QY10_9LEPT|nr:Ankyrin repeat protein [Leptospira santarosai]